MQAYTPEQLQKIYEKKVLNQELALKEFAERKLTLQARPSKLMLELGEQGMPPMRPDVFSKVAELLETAYFVDLRGLDYALADKKWNQVIERFEHQPLINWHSVTHLQLDNPEVWQRLAGLGLMFGVFMRAATPETSAKIAPNERFDRFIKNMEIIGNTLKEKKRGFMYLIVMLNNESFKEMPRFVELAKRFGAPEIQFKIITTVDAIERQFPIEPKTVTDTLDLAIASGVRVTLNDQDLVRATDPEKIIRASKAPYDPILNFPPRDLPQTPEAREFERLHGWRGIDSKVLERSKVSVYQKCFKSFHYLHVRRNGTIGPCSHLMYPGIEMGSLQIQSFEEIWNGQAYQDFRKALTSRQPQDPRCQWCFKHRVDD